MPGRIGVGAVRDHLDAAGQGVLQPVVDDEVAVERGAGVGADAVVVTGAGCRTTPIIADLEALAGAPVIGADGALFWALADAAGLALRDDSVGELTEATRT